MIYFNYNTFFTLNVLYYYILISCVDSADHLQDTCPLWHYYSKTRETCKCCYGSQKFNAVIECATDYLYIDNTYCMTWNKQSHGVEVAKCLRTSQKASNYHLKQSFKYYKLSTNTTGPELNDVTCNVYNRKGAQCRHCIDGHGPAVFSDGFTCADCSEHRHLWVLNLLFQLTMVTIFYIIVIVFQINGTSSPFNVFITYSQLLVYQLINFSGVYAKLIVYTNHKLFIILSTFFGIFNLDFFRFVIPPMCVSTSLKSLHVLLFDYIIAVFPIVLTILIYVAIELHDRNCFIIVILSSPLRRYWCRNWNPKETILTTCVTFLLLSYSKFLFASSNLLQFIHIYHCRSGKIITNQTVLFHDPTIRYLHSEHIPYAILALFVIAIFVLLPLLLLLLYPTRLFKKCLSCCGFQRWDILHFVMDIFQGWYKDGTEGTCDCRYFSSLYMILRFLFSSCISIFMVSFDISSSDYYARYAYIISGLLHVLLGVLFFTLKPYKIKWMNLTDGVFLTVIGVVLLTYFLNNKVIYIFITIVVLLSPFFIFLFVIFKCLKKFCA